MKSKVTTLLLTGALALAVLSACQVSPSTPAATESSLTVDAATSTAAAEPAAANEAAPPASAATVAPAVDVEPTSDAETLTVDTANATHILLNGATIAVEGEGVSVDGALATITAAGIYSISGVLDDGQIRVDTQDEATVTLILDGADISNASSAPINVVDAEEVIILLADGSVNHVADGATYVYEDPTEDEPNAAIFSDDALTIDGSGALIVDANYNDGIASKDSLVISGGEITVTAVDDGIRGKDSLMIEGGVITVEAGGDGLKSDNEEDADQGVIAIGNGVITVTAGGDGIQAVTDLQINGGQVTVTSGGGSTTQIGEDDSAKGLKSVAAITIGGGVLTIDSADDAVHSNGAIVINGGDFTIATGDDGIHADSAIEINDGQIQITQSREGIESAVITINGGDIHLVSSDDGLNVAGDNDPAPGRPGGQSAGVYTGDQWLRIHGGQIVVIADGDGIDVNGAIEMTDGVVTVHGPTRNDNGALDYDATFEISGGFLATAGSAGMAQAPGPTSSQHSLLINYPSTIAAGTLVHIQSSDGEDVLTFAPLKNYQSVTFSSPALVDGGAYELYYAGSSDGVEENGLYVDGSYTPGTSVASFTISNIVTRIQ